MEGLGIYFGAKQTGFSDGLDKESKENKSRMPARFPA